jgi:threonine dehydrogenase-like Zn-dependent dehydrogenase
MTAVVDALGPGVAGVAVGETVAVEPIRACGTCHACRRGRDAICRDVRFLGVHIDGGMADYVTIPAKRLFPIDARVPVPVAAMAEPMAVIVHGLERARFEAGQRVLVLGAGNLGLLTVVAARALGADDVWITARYDHQAALAEQLGAGRVLREADATPEALDLLGREHAIDCAVETVGGTADTLAQAIAGLRPGGTVSVVGLFAGDVSLPALPLFQKEITLAWSNCYDHPHEGADFAQAVHILEANAGALASLATHQVPLEDAQRAFALAADKRAGTVKVTLVH